MIGDTVAYLREPGREVIYDAEHFFDGWKAQPRVRRCRRSRPPSKAGPTIVVLCDTNGGSMPEEVAALTKAAAAAVDVPLGIHSTTTATWPSPTRWPPSTPAPSQVQGTINGLGERCGNADLVSRHRQPGPQEQGYEVLGGRRRRASHRALALRLRNRQHELPHEPAVRRPQRVRPQGRHARPRRRPRPPAATSTSTPSAVGNERRMLVSELSGRSNIVALTDQVQPAARQGADGARSSSRSSTWRTRATSSRRPRRRSTCWSSERPARSSRTSSGCTTTSTSRPTATARPTTEATVKLRVGDEVRHEVAEGDGPVNALDAALRKALNGHFPNLRGVQLVDYKVRVINSDAGTAAGVRVVIESRDEDGVTWGTVGVSENVIEASWDCAGRQHRVQAVQGRSRQLDKACK